jgi:hypothetical protein
MSAATPGAPFVRVSREINRPLEETFAYVVKVANRERLVALEKNKSFSYTTFGFSGSAQKDLLDRIDGHWHFTDNGNGTTEIELTYTLMPKGEQARSAIEIRLLPHYRDRLESAMNIIKEDLES